MNSQIELEQRYCAQNYLPLPVVSLCVAMEVQIMNEEKDVEFTSSQRILDPEAGDTIVYFPRAEPASGGVDAPVG